MNKPSEVADKPKRVHWVAELTQYIRRHIFGKTPATEKIPQCKDRGAGAIVLEGSPNQKWLQVACGLLTGDARWVQFAIERYAIEREQGHCFQEALSASHRWQYLTAHAAIRWIVRFVPWVKDLPGVQKALPEHVAEAKSLREENDLWWDHEASLLKRFYSPEARQVVVVGARNDPREHGNFPTSSEADAFGAFFAGSPNIRLPKNLGQPDTWCREVGEKLRQAGAFASVRTDRFPKLFSPVHVSTRGPLRSWWEPRPEVSKPSYRAEVIDGKPRFWFEPSQPDDKAQGGWETIGE